MSFTFADLFAGIGGFHAALSQMGGRCVFASELDRNAAAVYERNWGHHINPARGRPKVEGDIVPLTAESVSVPKHDVLAAGFPCQPFSKSGFQKGMDEARGTLFWNILRILEARRPPLVILENVRNLAGPRHRHELQTIIRCLRDLGYRVSDDPSLMSPHLLPPYAGGTPQVRERVFITGTYVGKDRAWAESEIAPICKNEPLGGWRPEHWDLDAHLLQDEKVVSPKYRLTKQEVAIIDTWNDFVVRLLAARKGSRLPGFPLWADEFRSRPRIPSGTPDWKADFLRKNAAFYREHKREIDRWLERHSGLADLPPSRRKLEWQAQDAKSLWDTVMHFRPSGIRAKRPTYLPALVAITQTSIIGARRRRITPREAARLQGFPDTFDFGPQGDAETYKQLGNAVCVGVVSHIVRTHVAANRGDLPARIVTAISDQSPTADGRRPRLRIAK
jgi:DNA (cytosine-5)-methyltransferase 1